MLNNFGNLLLSSMPLGIDSVSTSIGDLQRTYLYKLTVELPLPPGMSAFKNAEIVRDKIDLYQTKGIWPNRKTQPIALKWGGETFYHSGIDESAKTGQLTFRLSQDMGIKDFWEAAKDLTGDLVNHAAKGKLGQVLTLMVYMYDTEKLIITDCRKLRNVLVYSVDTIELNKEGDGIVTFVVDISWDRQERMDALRGEPI